MCRRNLRVVGVNGATHAGAQTVQHARLRVGGRGGGILLEPAQQVIERAILHHEDEDVLDHVRQRLLLVRIRM
jgi:hypothetical protein